MCTAAGLEPARRARKARSNIRHYCHTPLSLLVEEKVVKVLSVLVEITIGAERSQSANVIQRVSRASSFSYALRQHSVACGIRPGCGVMHGVLDIMVTARHLFALTLTLTRTCCGSAAPPMSAARRQRPPPPAEMAALETASGGRCSAALMVSSAFSTSFFASCRTPCGMNEVLLSCNGMIVWA